MTDQQSYWSGVILTFGIVCWALGGGVVLSLILAVLVCGLVASWSRPDDTECDC